MSEKYRIRWRDGYLVYSVEQRSEKKVFGFWPVYVWEAVAQFYNRKDAVWWINKQEKPE